MIFQYLLKFCQIFDQFFPIFGKKKTSTLTHFFCSTGHGPQTGRCVPNDKSDRYGNITVCEIQSWYDYGDDDDDDDNDNDGDDGCNRYDDYYHDCDDADDNDNDAK